MQNAFEAATYLANLIGTAYVDPVAGDAKVRSGRAGRDLAEMVGEVAAERGIRFGAALQVVLADERVSRHGQEDEIRGEALMGWVALQEA